MTDKPNLKKFLISLRKNGIINENIFIQSLDKIAISSKTAENQLTPLLDMIRVLENDLEIQNLDFSLDKINMDIKNVASSWEKGELPQDETKRKLTELVKQQNFLMRENKQIQARLNAKISRLKNLEKISIFSLDEFISYLIQHSKNTKTVEICTDFLSILKKYSKDIKLEDSLLQQHLELDTVEADILESIMTPIIEKDPIVFDLEEVIKPENRVDSLSILSKQNKKEYISSDETKTVSMDFKQVEKSLSIWDLVGKIAYNPNKTPVGLFRPPIVVDGKTYLPIVWEDSMPVSLLKKRYREIFEQTQLNLDLNTTQQIKTSIAETLNVPTELALQPSIFNQWISEIGAEAIPAKPHLLKVMFIEENKIINYSLDPQIIDNDYLKKIRVPAWIPAPGKETIRSVSTNQRVYGMANSNFGKIIGIMRNTPFGEVFIIEREVPPSYILDLFLDGLGKQNLAELRFSIAKNLKIGEGEAFLPASLWLINNKERLLISPHEILASYYTVLPSDAFIISKTIKAKTGVYFHSIPETFRYLIGKPLFKDNNEKGLVYGFSINQSKFSILWSSKTPVNVIREIGRKSSTQYVNRFQRRVAMALGIPLEEGLWPSNLARYFINFIWIEENQPLKDITTKIEQQFSLQRILFSEIAEITKDGLKCKKKNG